MKHQKLFVCLMSIIFVTIFVLCAFFTFSIKEINVKFDITKKGEEYAVDAQTDADEYLNKNLLFFDTGKIKTTLEKYSYFDIISVTKVFPNKIEVCVKERQEGYFVKANDSYYILDVNGFCLKEVDANYEDKEALIELFGVKFDNIEVGKTVEVEKIDLFNKALDMSKAVNLTNCVKAMTIDSRKDSEAVLFETHTEVGILVYDIMDDGVAKVQEAFLEYDDMTDYEKSYYWLLSYKLEETNKVKVIWTSESELSEYLNSLKGVL